MGALNQPSAGEIERRRAVWALTGLGWIFVCLAWYGMNGLLWFNLFPHTVTTKGPGGEWVTYQEEWRLGYILEYFQMNLDINNLYGHWWMSFEDLLPWLIGAAACVAFLAAKGVGCRQRWGRRLGAVVAVFATIPFSWQIFAWCWHWRFSTEPRESTLSTTPWVWVDYHWLFLSFLCLFLGVSALCTIIRMWIIGRSGR